MVEAPAPFLSSPFCAGDRGRLGVGGSGFPGEGSAPRASPLPPISALPPLLRPSAPSLGLGSCADRLRLSCESWRRWRRAEVMSETPPLTARAEKVSVDAGRGGGGKGPGWGRGCVEEAGGRTAGGGSGLRKEPIDACTV